MTAVAEIPAPAAEATPATLRAEFLRARAQVAGTSILAYTPTDEIAEVIECLATGTDEVSIHAAADLLWEMPEAERIEAFSMEEDDEKSYLAAMSPSAA